MDVIKERVSIRKYKDQPVPKELIDEIIEAGIYAPTGRNNQSTRIIAVTDREMRDRIMKANADIMGSTADPFYGAPVILIVIADKTAPTYIYDGPITLGYMMLKAKELGLGTCWIHRAKQEFEGEIGKEILKKLGIEGEFEGIGHLALGYPDENPAPKEHSPGRVYYI